MNVLYFAWVKEKVGLSEETVTPPAEVTTVAQLTAWLAARSAKHAAAFQDARLVKVAVDQVHYCLESLPHLPSSCLSRLLAKVVGVCIVLRLCANKAPVINNIVRSNSVSV